VWKKRPVETVVIFTPVTFAIVADKRQVHTGLPGSI